ncbi:MAG: hypothetical protein WCP65_06280 [Bacteroidota bacterium]
MKKVLTVVLLVAAFCSCKKTDNTQTPYVLPAPSNLSVQLINNKAALNWTNNSSSYTGIKVERRYGTGAFTLLVSLNGNALSYTDTTIKSDTVSYRIYAYNNSGNSAYSNEVYIAPVTLLNTGSNWRYAFATGSDSATAQKDTFTLTVLSYDSIIQGNHYKILGDSLQKYNLFYRSVGDTDYRRGLFSTIKGGLIPDIEEPFFLENTKVGTSWSLPINFSLTPTFQVNATNNYSILSLTDTLTVNNIFYSNVSHVQIIVKAFGLSVGGGDFYYAQGYGALKYVFSVNYSGVKVYQSETLLSSHLK